MCHGGVSILVVAGSVVIDKAATTVKGSMNTGNTFMVNLDWKDSQFTTEKLTIGKLLLKQLQCMSTYLSRR